MKKIFIILAALLLGTIATWAQGLSFTIYPEESGTFSIFYSTKNTPLANAVKVDWGNGNAIPYHDKAENGSNPTQKIEGTVRAGIPISIYSNCIEAIYIRSTAKAIQCQANNPQLQYFYYLKDNLSSEALEVLYMSLPNKKGHLNKGEIFLSQSTTIAEAGDRILKSNAFIAIDLYWELCSFKGWTGDTSLRIHWWMNEDKAKANLIPAITLKTPTTENITDLQISIKPKPEFPFYFNFCNIRIDDGTSNNKSVGTFGSATDDSFTNNAPKLTVKGTGASGLIKIYGALVSHIKTNQISALDISNTNNLRYIYVNNCSELANIPGLYNQKLLRRLDLDNNVKLTNVDVKESPELAILRVGNCSALAYLYFDGTNLEILNISECANLGSRLSDLQGATNLTTVYANNLGLDACGLDAFYKNLPTVTGNAEVYVNNDSYTTPANDWSGSNKTIATNKGWTVYQHRLVGKKTRAEIIEGDGGGCMPSGPAALSFTVYPKSSGSFTFWYSTKNAPLTNVMQVDWGNGDLIAYNGKAETGSEVSKYVDGTVTKGQAIKVYSNCLEAFLVNDLAVAIKCEANNPELKYIYYWHNNLSPEDLEALYLSLKDRNDKDWGELHLSNRTSIVNDGGNILKSNAFIALDKKWYVCSTKKEAGSFSERINWNIDENSAKTNLIPAITLQSPTTTNITDLQLGITQSQQLPWDLSTSTVRIDDGTNNYKSLEVSSYETKRDFATTATKLTIKGTGTTGIVKIYGALVSHFKTEQVSTLNFDNTKNLRYVSINNTNYLTEIPGLSSQKLLKEALLLRNSGLKSIELLEAIALDDLCVFGCTKLETLHFNTTNLEYLDFGDCSSLKNSGLSPLGDATKLNTINAGNLGWDACELDALYNNLCSSPPSGARVRVNSVYNDEDYNDWEGSNKTIATDKGWIVHVENSNSVDEVTGDGGGCKTGISEAEANQFIAVYPNPANDIVNITIGQNLNAESLQVIDFTGKIIYTAPLSPSEFEHQIDVSNYAKGIYLICIDNVTRKLLVK